MNEQLISPTHLQGSSLNLVTPTEETRTTLSTDEGRAEIRFLTPSQSSMKQTVRDTHGEQLCFICNSSIPKERCSNMATRQ